MTEFDIADDWENTLTQIHTINRVSELWDLFDEKIEQNNLRSARRIIYRIADAERVPSMKENAGEYIKDAKQRRLALTANFPLQVRGRL
ncbi:hypothetical protein E4L95_16595 [Paracoccus liaowanqingii]|uniref:Uncharacterized protein n=1 Tax=Paracoccus liaowanqingii TaxID=2560053 RepID=A0A4Z1BSH9_9RHOB|nr:hypothetical protein [Paracoccus liaowanqingii]TGN51827.1 hypothetical protein E4L95_16595 [Paracoccus liaowanqingii]